MTKIPAHWKQIITDLRHEIHTTHTARSNPQRRNNPAALAFWDEYLLGLRLVRDKILLACHNQTPKQYAAARTPVLTLSEPPVWTDFFKPTIKAEMRQRQAAFMPTTKHAFKQVFDPERRARRGAQAEARFWRIWDKDRQEAENTLYNAPHDSPSYATAQRELFYLQRSEQRFKARKLKSKVPPDWRSEPLMTRAEVHDMWRTTPVDDAPKPFDVTDAVPAPVDESKLGHKPKKDKGKPGRPVGAKDSAPRKRSPHTDLSKLTRARRKEKKDAYQNMQTMRLMGQDPYDIPKESAVDILFGRVKVPT